MVRKQKKLMLSRETLRTLQPETLGAVHGQGSLRSDCCSERFQCDTHVYSCAGYTCPSDTDCSNCPTCPF